MDEHILQLQPRLRLLADLVGEGARLVDVGTDHAYLPTYLLQQGKISCAIATDIHDKPLQHARETAALYGVENRLFLRLCDGLAAVEAGECDLVVIAGMGGDSIAAILSAAPWTADGAHRLLLQPMTKAEMLRGWLAESGYIITGERLVRDRDFLYPVLMVRGGQASPLTEAEQFGGVGLKGDPLYREYLDHQIERLRRAADGLRLAADGREAAEQKDALRQKLEEMRDHLC